MKKQDGSEKRRFTRVGKRWFLVFQELDSQLRQVYKSEIKAESKNASSGGMLFRCSKKIPLSTLIELEVQLPEHHEAIVTIAKVVRVIPVLNEDPPGYDIAVNFIWLHRKDKARLLNALSENAETDSNVREIPSTKTEAL